MPQLYQQGNNHWVTHYYQIFHESFIYGLQIRCLLPTSKEGLVNCVNDKITQLKGDEGDTNYNLVSLDRCSTNTVEIN